jgi:hypothetical protein
VGYLSANSGFNWASGGPRSQSVSTKAGTYGLNAFTNPAGVYSEFRPCVLGHDTSCGGSGNLRGLPTWDLDANIVKDVGIYRERVSAKFFISITDVMNHFQAGSPGFSHTTPNSFGQINQSDQHAAEYGVRNQTRLISFYGT